MKKDTAKNRNRVDPYKSYKFRLAMNGKVVLGADKVSPLKRTIEVVTYREGTDGVPHKVPGRCKYESITLERGLTADSEFEKWVNEVEACGAEATSYKKELTLERVNEKGNVVFRCLLHAAWVSELTVRLESNKNAKALAIESLKIELERWERAAAEGTE